MIYQLCIFYLAFLVANATSTLGKAAAATGLGVHINTMKLGVGRVFQRGRLIVGWLPISASFTMATSYVKPEGLEPRRLFDLRPRWVRFTIAISGNIALVLLACALRGAEGWRSFVNGFAQIVTGTFRPESAGAQLVEGYLRAVETQGALDAIGIVAAKLAAFNLLPVPIFEGGLALGELLRKPGPRAIRVTPAIQIGIALWVMLAVTWLYAIYVALSR